MELNVPFKKLVFSIFAGSIFVFSSLGSSWIHMSFGFLEGLFLIFGVLILLRAGQILSKTKTSLSPSRWIQKIWLIFYSILAAGLFYTLVNYAVSKNDLRWDVTRYKQHTLLPSTQKFLNGINQEIRFTVFFVGIPPKYLEDLLKSYERYSSGKIETEMIDPLVDIGYAAQFGNVISGKESKVIVRTDLMRRDVDFSSEPLNEGMLNNALIQITRPERQAYFLSGHGEYDIEKADATGFSSLARILRINNITSQYLLLNEGTVPNNCDILIIAGPKSFLLRIPLSQRLKSL
jgi:hypothetical protein